MDHETGPVQNEPSGDRDVAGPVADSGGDEVEGAANRDENAGSGSDAGEHAELSGRAWRVFVMAMVFEVGLGVVSLAVGRLIGVRPLATLHPSDDAALWGTLATVPLLLGLLLADRYPIGPLADLRRVVDELIVPMFRGLQMWQLALISMAAGFGEETLFRGLVQAGAARALAGLLGSTPATIAALVAASLLFGAMHPITRTYAALCVVVGLYLGAIWLATGNLLVPIVIHSVYDFVALLYLLRDSRSRDTGGHGEPGYNRQH